jgi:hypothetical protein
MLKKIHKKIVIQKYAFWEPNAYEIEQFLMHLKRRNEI